MKILAIPATVAVLLLSAAGVAGYLAGQRADGTAQPPAAAAGRKILYWHDPMMPDKRFDKPGKSPFMDMDLVPVYAGEQADEGAVRISPGVQQNLGIRYAQVREGDIGGTLRLAGNVAYNERERVLVQARSNGYVERLYVRAPLDPVRKGQPLLELYVPEWVAAQEEYLSIRRMGQAQAAGLLDGALQRMRLAGMTDEQIRQVAARGQVLRRVTVTAPVAGVVSELAAREGATVASGAPLMTISSLQSVWVNAAVPESAAGQVRPGVPVQASTTAYPGERFTGKVEALLPEVDPATRTLTARIQLANPAGKLSPGMFADITVASPGSRPVLLVPSEAVFQSGTRSLVIVAEEGGRFLPVEVSTGAESNGETQVLTGLRAGQRVVASGQFLIDSEASLRGAVRRLESGANAAGQTPAAPAIHHASGRIEKIAPDEITISHGPVPTLNWGPMTMGFVPPAAGVAPGLKVGDSVDFDMRARPDGRYEITGLRVRPGLKPQPQAGVVPGGHGLQQHGQPAAPAAAPEHAAPEHAAPEHAGHVQPAHAGHNTGAEE